MENTGSLVSEQDLTGIKTTKYQVLLYKKNLEEESVELKLDASKEYSDEELLSKAFYELFKKSCDRASYTKKNLAKFHEGFAGGVVIGKE